MSWVGSVPFEEIGMTSDKHDLLKELAEDGGYWANALSFLEQVSSRKFSTLSKAQRDWITEIEASLADKLSIRTLRKGFGYER